MSLFKSGLIIFSSLGLLFLAACNKPQVSDRNSTPTPTAAENASANSATSTTAKTEHPTVSKGGQVVETGLYHLEFIPEKEANGTHLDFYLQKGNNHEPLPNAKVTAQIQLPDGTQKTLALSYDVAGKHYAVLLPETAPGQYQVKMNADINGEKVSGRFNFNK